MFLNNKILLFVTLIMIPTILLVLFSKDYFNKDVKYPCKDCNVIIVLVDALRWDHLGCYNYYRNTSPNIDNLCQKGIVFENAISQGVATKQAVASLFTSLYVNEHNVSLYDFLDDGFYMNEFDGSKDSLSDSALTLAEIMKKNKYKTQAFIGNPNIKKVFGFNQGFEGYEIQPDIQITESAIQWIIQNKDKKLFLYLHYMAPHTPYDPPEEYQNKFGDKYDSGLNFTDKHKEFFNSINFSKSELNELIDRYDEEICFVDNEVGKIIKILEKEDLMKNTILVITADHGEALKEKDFIGHGYLYNTVIQIPLIIVNPKTTNYKRIESMVESIDIAPTILRILLIQIPDMFSGNDIFSEKKEFAFSSELPQQIAIRSKEYLFKYTIYGKKELYNINNDPYELHPLSNSSQIINKFNILLENYLKLPNRNLNSVKEVDNDTLQEIKSFGYIN
jgi:arylsulfatase A-like enzyme